MLRSIEIYKEQVPVVVLTHGERNRIRRFRGADGTGSEPADGPTHVDGLAKGPSISLHEGS